MNWRRILYLQAICLDRGARYDAAMGLIRQVFSYDRDHLAPDDVNHLASEYELGKAYIETGQIEKGLTLLAEVVEIEAAILPPTHQSRLLSQYGLGKAYIEDNQIERGLALLAGVVEIEATILPPTHRNRLLSQYELGRAYLYNNQVEKAIQILEPAQMNATALNRTDPIQRYLRYQLADAYYRHGSYEKALPLIREVTETDAQKLEPDDPNRRDSKRLLLACTAALQKPGLGYEELTKEGKNINRGYRTDDNELVRRLVHDFATLSIHADTTICSHL